MVYDLTTQNSAGSPFTISPLGEPSESLMKTLACLFLMSVVAYAQPPQLPAPTKEHEWLKQCAGEWTTTGECFMEPGKPSKCSGTESSKMLGDFWCITNINGNFGGMEMKGIMTIGYDPDKKQYVGTWVDNVCGHMWKYEGTLDAAGKVLTLNAEGPSPVNGKPAKFKDVMELKDKDTKVFTSSMQGEDGKWIVIMSSEAKRK